MKKESVRYVVQNLQQINIQKQKPVPENAQIKCVGVKSIKKVNPEPVYNMEVEDNHNFAINDGLIVHNCMDAVRYFVETKKLGRVKLTSNGDYEKLLSNETMGNGVLNGYF